jgi:hypothetical protein
MADATAKLGLTPAGRGVAFRHERTNPTDDARQHAPQWHALARGVVLEMPPRGPASTLKRGPITCRCRHSARDWCVHGALTPGRTEKSRRRSFDRCAMAETRKRERQVCRRSSNASSARGQIASDSRSTFLPRFDCPRCGAFVVADDVENRTLPNRFAENPLRRSLMSWALRRMQRPDDAHLHIITSSEVSSFWREERLPNPQQLADSLILWTGDRQPMWMRAANAPRTEIAAWIGLPITSPDDAEGMAWLFDQLRPKQLFDETLVQGGHLNLKLTMAGWEAFERLRRATVESRTAFMAMQFDDATLKNVVDTCFRPAVDRAGFVLRVLTDQQPAGSIDDQLRAALLSARFVIADLTHGNRGACWESGFAEGLGRPVIYTCKKEVWANEATHFDTNHLLTIIWSEANLEEAGRKMTATIRATLRTEAKPTGD